MFKIYWAFFHITETILLDCTYMYIAQESLFRKYAKVTFFVFVSWCETFVTSTIRAMPARVLCVLSIAMMSETCGKK